MDFVRGDTFSFKFKITTSGGGNITINDIDTLFITCREYPNESSPIIFQKTKTDVTIDNNYCHVVFEPEDTEKLDLGMYYFDVEITLPSGYRKSKLYTFTLTPETTIHGCEE